MKTKKKADPSSIEFSAERIERLLNKCKMLFLYTFLLKGSASLAKLRRSNLFQFSKMSLHSYFRYQPYMGGKKKPLKSMSLYREAPSPHYLLLNYPLPGKSELSPDRVMRWKLKEYQTASRRLKNLKSPIEFEAFKPHKITLLSQDKSVEKKSSDQDEFWKELIKTKDERLFHIDRVIKYLTDL